jgi:hypothetical protein
MLFKKINPDLGHIVYAYKNNLVLIKTIVDQGVVIRLYMNEQQYISYYATLPNGESIIENLFNNYKLIKF